MKLSNCLKRLSLLLLLCTSSCGQEQEIPEEYDEYKNINKNISIKLFLPGKNEEITDGKLIVGMTYSIKFKTIDDPPWVSKNIISYKNVSIKTSDKNLSDIQINLDYENTFIERDVDLINATYYIKPLKEADDIEITLQYFDKEYTLHYSSIMNPLKSEILRIDKGRGNINFKDTSCFFQNYQAYRDFCSKYSFEMMRSYESLFNSHYLILTNVWGGCSLKSFKYVDTVILFGKYYVEHETEGEDSYYLDNMTNYTSWISIDKGDVLPIDTCGFDLHL